MDGEIQKDTHRYTIRKNHVGSYVGHTSLGNFSIAVFLEHFIVAVGKL